MNDKWLLEVHSLLVKKSGQFYTYDTNQVPVVIDWYVTNIMAPELALFKKEVSCLAAQVTADAEVALLRKYPDAVYSGSFFKACEPLFAGDVSLVDWTAVEDMLKSTVKNFYLMDVLQFGQEVIALLSNDLYCFASIKNQETGVLLGFFMSSITPALPYGDIKIINLVISPEHLDCGLEQLLLGSVLRIVSVAKRLFIVVRPTSYDAIEQYKKCGFVKDNNPVQDPHHAYDKRYLEVFEYQVDKKDILQKISYVK